MNPTNKKLIRKLLDRKLTPAEILTLDQHISEEKDDDILAEIGKNIPAIAQLLLEGPRDVVLSYEDMEAYVDLTASPVLAGIIEDWIELNPNFRRSIDAMQDVKAEIALRGTPHFQPPKKRAIREFVESLLAKPTLLGVHAYDYSDSNARIDSLRSAVESHPRDPIALYNLASCLSSSESTREEAAGLFERALVADPSLAPAMRDLGALALDSDPVRAESLLRKAVEVNPADAASTYYLGLALAAQNLENEAKERLRRAADLDPEDARPLNDLGAILLDEEAEDDEAVRLLRRAVKLAPDSGVYHANLAAALFQTGDRVGAEAEANRAMALQSPRHWVFDALDLSVGPQ